MVKNKNIDDLRAAVQQFVTERNWEKYHTPKSLSMSISIEAAELMEHFQWLSNERSMETFKDPTARTEIIDELADILIYCLSFANIMDIDVGDAILDKLNRSEQRYPIGYMPTEE